MKVKKPPAFYAMATGGAWRDYVNLLHLPYTLWHLSYVVWEQPSLRLSMLIDCWSRYWPFPWRLESALMPWMS